MPTVLIKTKPAWAPRQRGAKSPRSRGIRKLASWLPGIVASVLRLDAEQRGSANTVTSDMVYVDYANIDADAINATDVLILINPPEIDDDFTHRQLRRTMIRDQIWHQLCVLMESNTGATEFPGRLEVEVICVESSGLGTLDLGFQAYDWGNPS